MNSLQTIFSSKVRAEIFRVLFTSQATALHLRELARQCHLHEATVRQELEKLTAINLVNSHRDGNRKIFRANLAHPVYPEIRNLVLKTTGIVELLQTALAKDDIEISFVFGSIAEGTEAPESDVDLMVLGNIGLRKLSARLMKMGDRIGREINPHVMTRAEYRKRIHEHDHFATHVLSGPKLFIKGSAHDLVAMAR